MMHLASFPAETVAQIADISKEWNIPEVFLRKIVAKLAKAGLVVSYRGVGGGIALAKPAETITLLDVIEKIEGPMALNKCLLNPRFCNRSASCGVHAVWCEAQEKMREVLGARSLAALVLLTRERGMQKA